MPRIPLLGGAYEARDVIADAQRCINLFPEVNPRDSPVPVTHYPTPGLDPIGVPQPLPPTGITTWNPLDRGALTLSNANLTACLSSVSQQQWFAGQSCEIMAWPLTASGANPTPTVDIQGSMTTLTSALGNLNSNTLAVDIDTASGKQYVLQQNKQTGDNLWDVFIPIFAGGVTGNVAPASIITFTNTEFIDQGIELLFGGICLDAAKNIYVAFAHSTNTFSLWKITAGSSGSVTATLLTTDTNYTVTSLCYDSTNNLIWASGYLNANPFSGVAKSYSTAGVLNSTITSTNQQFSGEVFIGPAGKIVLSGVQPSNNQISVTEVWVSGSSGTNPATSQSISITPPGGQGPVVACGAMDSNGLLYLGPIFDAGLNETIEVFAAGVSGSNPATLRTFYSSLFKNMLDTTATNIQQIVVR